MTNAQKERVLPTGSVYHNVYAQSMVKNNLLNG